MWINRYVVSFLIAQGMLAPYARANPESPSVAPTASSAKPKEDVQVDRLIGNMVFTDRVTKFKQVVPVTVKETNVDRTIYSSGDVVAKDGRVLQIRVGDAVFRPLAGSLWTLPLKSGTEGRARVELLGGFANQTFGSIAWKARLTQNSQVIIDATIDYRPIAPTGYAIGMFGTWTANYSNTSELPDISLADIRGSAATTGGVYNFVGIEFQPLTDAVPQIDREIGTMVFTDSLTKIAQILPLTAKESNPDRTTYSSGDVVSKDGRVLQVRVGDAVFRPVAGALWILPLKSGTAGQARVELLGASHQTVGTIDWIAKLNQSGDAIVEATVAYRPTNQSSYRVDMFGTWIANYGKRRELPDTSLADIRGFGHHGGILNMIGIEFQPR